MGWRSLWEIGLRKLKTLLENLKIRKWLGPEAFLEVEMLTTVRDWKGWCLAS